MCSHLTCDTYQGPFFSVFFLNNMKRSKRQTFHISSVTMYIMDYKALELKMREEINYRARHIPVS